MEFREIIKKAGKGNLILGENEAGFLSVDLDNCSSVVITGETGSGKSILLDQILLELISMYTSLEMEMILIDTSGVELNYYLETNYPVFYAINDLDKAIVALSRVLKEINRRKSKIATMGVTTAQEYNELSDEKLPLLVVAIDDDKFLLRGSDVEKMLSGIISQISGLNILFLLATSDVHNKFFETNQNIYADLAISFDYTNIEESKKNNIDGSENLEIGAFLAKSNGCVQKYHNFNFDDKIIQEILNI